MQPTGYRSSVWNVKGLAAGCDAAASIGVGGFTTVGYTEFDLFWCFLWVGISPIADCKRVRSVVDRKCKNFIFCFHIDSCSVLLVNSKFWCHEALSSTICRPSKSFILVDISRPWLFRSRSTRFLKIQPPSIRSIYLSLLEYDKSGYVLYCWCEYMW